MTVPATRPAPAAASLPAGALTVLAMAQLIIALDATIVFVALPKSAAPCASRHSSCSGW